MRQQEAWLPLMVRCAMSSILKTASALIWESRPSSSRIASAHDRGSGFRPSVAYVAEVWAGFAVFAVILGMPCEEQSFSRAGQGHVEYPELFLLPPFFNGWV